MTNISSPAIKKEQEANFLFSLFMTKNWNTATGDWFTVDVLEEARLTGDAQIVQELEQQIIALDNQAVKLEENVYKTQIAAAEESKEFIADMVRKDSGKISESNIESLIRKLTHTYDNDIERATSQMEGMKNREKRYFDSANDLL